MATVNRVLSSANDGAVDLTLTYDNVTGAISQIALRNDGASGSMTGTLFDLTTGLPVFGPATRSFGTGTFTQPISGRSMVAGAVDKFNPDGWHMPFGYSLAWSSA